MMSNRPAPDYQQVVEALRASFEGAKSGAEVVDAYAELMKSIWSFMARLLGDGGAGAVLLRSVQVASREEPLIALVIIGHTGVDFSRFRSEVVNKGCTTTEVADAFVSLGTVVFRTLNELIGASLTEPLLKRILEEGDR